MPDWGLRVRARLSGLGLDPATEAEVIEELAQHLEDRYQELVARGATEQDAADQAWRELEGHERLAREIALSRRRLSPEPIQDTSRSGAAALLDDLRFAWRRLRHAPGFTIVALLTVTLTVGANTAILSIADAVLFRPLPYADADGVAIIQLRNRKTGGRSTMTPYAFVDAINSACPSVSEVGLLEDGPAIRLDPPEDGPRLTAMAASANYFGLLGAKTARGRFFSEADAGAEGRVAVMSYATWQQRYGGDEGVPGRSITLGALTFDIVGILPKGFVFPSLFAGSPSIVTLGKPLAPGSKGGTFHSIVRVAPGVTRDRAQSEIDAATTPVSAAIGRPDSGPVLDGVKDVLYPVGRPIMRYLLAAATLILILGCANLANMMLVRGRRSVRETAVRLALGASRLRIVRPMLFEAVIIGVAGAGLAVLLTTALFDALLKQVPPAAYGRAAVGVDARVIVLSLAMGLLGSVAFGVLPAWRLAGVDVLALIQRRSGGSRGRTRLGRPMVAAQVAIAVAVVFGAAIASRAFVSVLSTPLGFSADSVLRIGMAVPRETPDRQQFYASVLDTLAQRRDVLAAGAIASLPFSGQAADDRATGDTKEKIAGIYHVLPGYFEAAAVTVRRGRTLSRDDIRVDPNAAVVSASAARALFGDQEPLGAQFHSSGGREFHVVGVVDDVRQSLDRDSQPAAYVLPGADARGMTLVVRMRERREPAIAEIKADLRAVSPATPTVEWWADRISLDHAYRDPRFQTIVLGALAALALGLTTLGIFSVVAYLVAARTREMGVRLAIGASPRALVRLVVRQSLVPVLVGLACGLLLIKWGTRLAEAQLTKIDTHDPLIVALAVAAVTVATLLASWIPARRATRINPSDVLRAE